MRFFIFFVCFAIAVPQVFGEESCPNETGYDPTPPELKHILARHQQWLDKIDDKNKVHGTSDKERQDPLRANLCNMNLKYANLNGANLKHADLTGANLTRATLNRANLSYATLDEANLTDARLSGADLTNADLIDVNLTNAVLFKADLTNAVLFKADLTSASLDGANLTIANLVSADLSNATLKEANLTSANLTHANFSNAKLNGANLTKAQLIETNLSNTDLSKANFTNAKLKGADLTNANLTEANLSNATLSGANLTNAELSGASLSSADLTNANLTDANLSKANLSNAKLNGANLSNALYEPASNSLPNLDNLIGNDSLYKVRYKNPRALVTLRVAYYQSGLKYEAKKITRLLNQRETLRLLTPQNKDEGVNIFSRIEWVFKQIFFELPTDWGVEPGRALKILLFGVGFFMVFYLVALQAPEADAGIWRIRARERLRDEDKDDKELIRPAGFWSALSTALYFSLLSAFHFGWKDLNVGSWIHRIQHKEYTFRATGWVRTAAGIQSLISVYLVAMWALTYFGRPFD